MLRYRFGLVGLVVLVGCGAAGEGEPCLEDDGCAGALVCLGPDAPQVCGIPGQNECSQGSDCPGDQMCHAVRDPCASGQTGTVCDVGCPITPCEADFACSQGACVPRPCDGLAGDRFDCPVPLVCDPAAAVTAGTGPFWTHGCVEVDCAGDADCSDGESCVDGICQTGPGTCIEDVAAP